MKFLSYVPNTLCSSHTNFEIQKVTELFPVIQKHRHSYTVFSNLIDGEHSAFTIYHFFYKSIRMRLFHNICYTYQISFTQIFNYKYTILCFQ